MKRNRTRRALLAAAEAAFSSRVWPAARMEDIAAEAGVSAATAYNHFPTKQALVGQVYAPLIRPLITQAEHDVEVGRSAVDGLNDQVRALCRLGARYRQLTAAFWSAAQEYATRSPGRIDPDDPSDPRARAPVAEPIRLLIAHGQDTGELRRYPSAEESSEIVAELLLTCSVRRPHLEPEAAAELLLTVLFGMVRPELLSEADAGERPFAPPRPPTT